MHAVIGEILYKSPDRPKKWRQYDLIFPLSISITGISKIVIWSERANQRLRLAFGVSIFGNSGIF